MLGKGLILPLARIFDKDVLCGFRWVLALKRLLEEAEIDTKLPANTFETVFLTILKSTFKFIVDLSVARIVPSLQCVLPALFIEKLELVKSVDSKSQVIDIQDALFRQYSSGALTTVIIGVVALDYSLVRQREALTDICRRLLSKISLPLLRERLLDLPRIQLL